MTLQGVMSGVSFLANETPSFQEEKVDLLSIPPSSSQPEDVLSHAPPPAPPLPPPLLLGNPVRRKRRVRSFYWKPIPEERVKQDRPNLWTLGRHSRETSFHIDIRAIEELFGQRDDTRSPAAADRRMSRGSVKDLREQITILDSKRSMNISIFLKHLKNVCVDSIHVELSSVSERVHQLQTNIQTDDDLLTQLHSFLESAGEALVDLRVCSDVMVKEGNALIDFFCEDKETFKLDECFHIFQNFCSKFKKAIQENAERGAREESRSKRLTELEDKRHSWAGLEGVGGVFGLRSSSETDVEAALRREGLLDLLRTEPRSPLSPPLRFGSVRRSRQQRVNSDLTERHHVTSEPSGADTHALPPIHSLYITHTHSDTNTTHLHGNHAQEGSSKTKSDHDSSTTHACPAKPKTHTLQETQKHNIQTHPQQDTLRSDEMTFDPSQGNSGECERHNHSESSTRGDDNDVKLTPQQTNKRSLQSSDGHTRPIQTSTKKPIPKTSEPKHRPSVSAKPSSTSPRTSSSLSKSPHQRPVRTLTSSETPSLRKVVPISRSVSSGQRKSPVRGAKKKTVTRPPPEEKMCRATLRALGASAPQTSTHASQHRHTPGFARNTVASTTRHAVTPNQSSSSDPKHPPLTRTASLRLSRVLSPQRSPTVPLSKTQSVRLTPPAGHPRMIGGGGVSHQSQSKSSKPVWR
ncbi:FH2 domain-containing protein 1 [Triplophysa tibetana]|uniref:FH2 domain-containing protein 1 n=1 Tax=Triplophysa tibetana TaxID=1572043 RepID=A0A5A9NB74_9TELE|nr:FH2 domain-containing protein 1 [Triplophysa tibetana]